MCFIRLHNFAPDCPAASPCQCVSWGTFQCANNKILAPSFIRTLLAMWIQVLNKGSKIYPKFRHPVKGHSLNFKFSTTHDMWTNAVIQKLFKDHLHFNAHETGSGRKADWMRKSAAKTSLELMPPPAVPQKQWAFAHTSTGKMEKEGDLPLLIKKKVPPKTTLFVSKNPL